MPKHFCLSAAAASLAAALLLTMAAPAALAAPTPGADRVADADTRNDYLVSLGDDDSTLLDGRIWTDKSVDTSNIEFVGDAGTVTVENDSDFLVTYSALATSTQIISETTAPVDVVFVLDFSASMACVIPHILRRRAMTRPTCAASLLTSLEFILTPPFFIFAGTAPRENSLLRAIC